MNYLSLNYSSKKVKFKDAVINGLAPDKGLYYPEKIPRLPQRFFKEIIQLDSNEIAYRVISPFIGDSIPSNSLKDILRDTLNFNFKINSLNDNISSLELFHGPTLAFKDVGARFMARCLGYFNENKKNKKITVLVATSGDTGGAVADGFFNVEGINVVILYPKNKVSEIQERQLTTLGGNITALEIDGVFDDCQEMVKNAFIDSQINNEISITSANSINVARWLPQMFYYFFSYKEIINKPKIVYSVPSGNFGNICAGLLARELGLPIDHFIASTNENNSIPEFLKTGVYQSKRTVQTISNAMDVGDPSNFIRIQKLFNNDFYKLNKVMSGESFSDDETKEIIKKVYENYNYILDPHGAIGFLGLERFIDKNPDYFGVFLETAHPIKFKNIIEKTLNIEVQIPNRIKGILKKEIKKISISNYNQFKSFLLNL